MAHMGKMSIVNSYKKPNVLFWKIMIQFYFYCITLRRTDK